MTFPDDRDRELEELLRATLQEAGDGISPTGDGLTRIQQRVAARRGRRVWLRPLAAAGAVAVVGGAGTLAYALTRPPAPSTSVVTADQTPSSPPVASVTPSTTVKPKPATVAFPAAAFYPFATATAEQSWESQGGPASEPAMLDPAAVAELFAADFVQQPSVSTVMRTQKTASTAAVTLGRSLTDGTGQHVVPVTTVRLVHYGKAWLVTGADDPTGYLRVSAPSSGSTVGSPVTVSGPSYGVDENVAIDVRSLAGRDTTDPVAHVSFGNGSPAWATTVNFTVPQDPRGAVVAVAESGADGGPARIVVNAVTFAPATVVDYPRYFYGVKNGRVAKLATRNGATVSYVSEPQPGAGASDPQVAGDQAYFLVGLGTCSNALKAVPVASGTSSIVTMPRAGYTITSYAVSADGRTLALFESACQPDVTHPQGLLISSIRGTATSHTVEFPSFPPTLVGDPSWEPDGQHLDAVVRTGNTAGVVRWNAFTATSMNDGAPVCGDLSGQGLATAVDLDGTGAAWVALQTGGRLSVLRCVGTTHTAMFSVPGVSPQDIAITGNGRAVLVTDGSARVWRWTSGAAAATSLTPTVPQPQISW